ncbi:BTAD domain-containing putative transcriptional regulator [Kitasatospora sp. NPDC001309]|uniref:AfsR/SARP family transcriptional regulator n=1 Tax=Kitasatospora sp. NPDC001309 TaxID=3364013 RepID=UPI0036A71266
MLLRLLGSVELVHEGRSLDLGGPRQRVVLAMLGLNVDRTVSTEQLIDAVWGDAPPTTARGQIQVAVSTLRKRFTQAGRPEAITTRSPGYALELEPADVDGLEFERLVALAREEGGAGRVERAAATMREALALWRGPALDGVPGELAQRAATHLDDRRLTVLEERVRLDLLLGRHGELGAELASLTARHPLRERLYGHLMLALYRSGRQADALEAFQRARRALVEEIGIEPGQELRELERAILCQSPGLDLPGHRDGHARHAAADPAAPSLAPAPAPVPPVPLVSVAPLSPPPADRGTADPGSAPPPAPTAPAAAAHPGNPGHLVHTGQATHTTHTVQATLTTHPAHPAAEAAFRLTPRQLPASISDFIGRRSQLDEIKKLIVPYAGTQAPGYAVPIVNICGPGGVGKSALAVRAAHEAGAHFPDGHLYADLHTPTTEPGAPGEGGEGRTGTLLARFLRAVGVPAKAIPEDPQERAEMYRSRLADSRVLVVLDGVTSAEQVTPLLPGSASCAVLATSRVRLSRVPGIHRVDVEVFDMSNALDLLAGIIGRPRVQAELDTAVELVHLCDGLPLALRIAGARLASHPHWPVERLVRRLRNERRRLDELSHHGLELRSTISLTYRALPPSAQRLFRLFSLVQLPDAPAWIAAALLDCDPYTAEDTLDLLVEAQVMDIVQYPNQPGPRYRFHDLVRAYAHEQLVATEDAAEREAALTRMLGGWLALAEDAHRREYGGDYTVIHGTAERWRPPLEGRSGAAGTGVDGWDTERLALVTAVRQAAAAGLDELCWDLALTSVTLFEAKGHFDDWEETSRLAQEAAVRAGNTVGRAAMLYSLGTLHMFQTRHEQAQEHFALARELFEAAGHDHGRALVLRNDAFLDGVRGDDLAMREKYDEALTVMRLVGDRIGEAHILRSLAGWWMTAGRPEQARTLLEQALVICRAEHCVRVEAQVLQRFAELHLSAERTDLAEDALREVLRIVRAGGDRIGEAYALHGLGTVHRREGRLDGAVDTLTRALELSRQVGERAVEGRSRYALAEIALRRADRAQAAGHLKACRTLFTELGSKPWLERTEDLLAESRRSPEPAAEAGPALRLGSRPDRC